MNTEQLATALLGGLGTLVVGAWDRQLVQAQSMVAAQRRDAYAAFLTALDAMDRPTWLPVAGSAYGGQLGCHNLCHVTTPPWSRPRPVDSQPVGSHNYESWAAIASSDLEPS